MSPKDRDSERPEIVEQWERRAPNWGRRADRMRAFGMPVSVAMLDKLDPQPGDRVLELAAGPGDTGFLAAEMIAPGGTLVCSDAAAAMLDVARARAAAQGVKNVEFKQLELEWIDLPTASVDAVICRWGLMLVVDPAAALQEIRRVLRPGGRVALAVWDEASANPWATTPGRALIKLGHADPPDPTGPGMFALADSGRLAELLASAGFTEALVEAVVLDRSRPSVEDYIDEQLELSLPFDEAFKSLSDAEQAEVRSEIESLAAAFVSPDGLVRFPARSLVAAATA